MRRLVALATGVLCGLAVACGGGDEASDPVDAPEPVAAAEDDSPAPEPTERLSDLSPRQAQALAQLHARFEKLAQRVEKLNQMTEPAKQELGDALPALVQRTETARQELAAIERLRGPDWDRAFAHAEHAIDAMSRQLARVEERLY